MNRLVRAKRGGTTVLEFALTLPIFMLLFGGVIDCGWLFFEQSALDTSTHLGCRNGALSDTGVNDVNLNVVKAATIAAVKSAMTQSALACDGCSVTVETLYSNPARSLRCTTENEYQPLVGVVPPITLASRAIVRMEVQR